LSGNAKKYAQALADAVGDVNRYDSVERELRDFLSVLEASTKLKNVLANPGVPLPQKKRVLEELLLRGGYDRPAANFLRVVLDHGRMGSLWEFVEMFQRISYERQGYVAAEVTTARPLSGRDEQRLVEKLCVRTGKKIRLSTKVDPAIYGGAVTRIGSTILDGSVRKQLDLIRDELS
jgi:F-type H+-transporting ATPase subunit delta